MKLEFPHEYHKEMYEELCDEIEKFSEEFIHPDNIYAFRGEKYTQLLENVRGDRDGTRENRVPSTALFGIDNGKIIGAIQIRHNINHPNLEYRGGHIGYGVRPSDRQKGYASQMLKLALGEARKIGLDRVLITCDIHNIGSNKVIQNNGGVLEKECLHDDESRFNRYWITL